jgi:hypothetical protein
MTVRDLVLAAALAAVAADPLRAEESPFSAATPEDDRSARAGEFKGDAKQSYWGFGAGYVFNKVPISMSTFDVFMGNLWYSHIFGDPNDNTRLAGTLGLYGFQMLLPVPRAGLDFYVGRPSQDIQFKGGLGGFYDVAVGGHGGVSGEIGVVIKNRIDVSFMAVPFGTDSKRSYAEFMGLKSKEEARQDYVDAGDRWVEMPYFGTFVGLRF